MLENLYKFSKNAWHVKFFKWIYGTNPTKTFKTMCPYFWSFVFTILLLPLILVIKSFGKGGTQFMSKMELYKRDRINRLEQEFYQKYNDVSKLTDKECYELTNSKCWDEYKWILDNYHIIYDKSHQYNILLLKKKRESINMRYEKYNAVKESKYFTYISLGISLSVFSIIGYIFYSLFSIINFKPIDWELIYIICKYILVVGISIGILFILIKYILDPIIEYLKCIELPECRLCKLGIGKYLIMPFKFIGKIFLIIGDMIYATYKNHCPVITWKDE